ncbi:MAG: ATP-binding protein [Kofleriaceae bacterium]
MGAVELACERWYLLALAALARRDRNDAAALEFRERVTGVEAELRTTDDPFAALAKRLRLSATGGEFLAAALAFSVDPRLPPHADALGGPTARRGLAVSVFAELAGLAPGDGRSLVVELGGDQPVVANGIVICADDSVAPAARPYRVPHRVIAHLLGVAGCDPDLALITLDPTWVNDIAQSDALDEIGRVLAADLSVVLVIEGANGAGRRSAIACAQREPIVVLDADRVGRAGIERGLLALRREALLRDALPVVANAEALVGEGGHPLGAFLARHPGRIAITTSRRGLDLSTQRPIVRVTWGVPDVDVRKRLWGGTDVDDLAFRYRVGPGTIARARESAAMLHPDRALDAAALGAGLRHNIAERMGGIAEHIEVSQSWNDIVLAEDTLDQVHALVARVRHGRKVLDEWGYRSKIARGAGVAALFSGPPGTGKTMVSGIVARELGLELYQVDLSQVISKWVGETEKQLARVFDAAEEGHALLLFDEADSLFGQRSTEVKSAVDRYANLEVNFLLQRIESFGGITVLTTNLDSAIDQALKRRLAAHIVFAPPDDEEREQLWQRMTRTGSAPLAKNCDFSELARVFSTMTGANIRNSVLAAAFMAASTGAEQIDHAHLMRAARGEYRSMGHILADQGKHRLVSR